MELLLWLKGRRKLNVDVAKSDQVVCKVVSLHVAAIRFNSDGAAKAFAVEIANSR